MPKKPSSFDGESYTGYKVSIRLVREGLEEHEPAAVSSPADVCRFMNDLKDSDRERFYPLFLDTKNKVINCEEVACGTLSSAPIHPREVFKSALLCSCASIILVHNHPSGNPDPSPEDQALTKRLYDAGDLLGIEVLDSVIIGQDSYYSFKEAGMMGLYKGRK